MTTIQEADYCFVILEGASGRSVELVVRGFDDQARDHFQSVWQRLYLGLQSHHSSCGRPAPSWTAWKPWDWCAERKPGYEARLKYVAWCGDLPVGFINVWPSFQSPLQPNKDVLYLEHIAAAPGNQTTELWNRRYSSVGATLFAYAVLISHQQGFDGRLGLHVADPLALSFYRHIDLKCENSLFLPEITGIAGPTPRGEHDKTKHYLETTDFGATRWLEDYRRE